MRASNPDEQGQQSGPPTSFETKIPLELREMIYGNSLLAGSHFFYKHPEVPTDKAVLEPAFRPIDTSRYTLDRETHANKIEALKEGTLTAEHHFLLSVSELKDTWLIWMNSVPRMWSTLRQSSDPRRNVYLHRPTHDPLHHPLSQQYEHAPVPSHQLSYTTHSSP